MTTPTETLQSLAQELIHVTRGADKAIALLQKMFDPEGCVLDQIVDVSALHGHMISVGTSIFAEMLTEDELRAALAYFNSPLGQSLQAKQTLLDERMSASLTAYLPTVIRSANSLDA